MTDRAIDLSALLGSRICHDLISPLGAISNGVELMSMSGQAPSAEMSLIAESVENANAKIRFFRLAFGAADAAQSVGLTEIRSLLNDLSATSRVTIDWQHSFDLARREAKLAFLLLLCLETAMPFGGKIEVRFEDKRWHMTGQSAKARVMPDLWEVLSNPGAEHEVSPAEVHFALVPPLMAEIGRSLTLDIRDGEIRITA